MFDCSLVEADDVGGATEVVDVFVTPKRRFCLVRPGIKFADIGCIGAIIIAGSSPPLVTICFEPLAPFAAPGTPAPEGPKLDPVPVAAVACSCFPCVLR